jgi:polyphosphate glucokinase
MARHDDHVTKPGDSKPTVLAVDVGGSHVKLLLSSGGERRRFDSGPELTAREMVDGVAGLTSDWSFDVVSIGVPAAVHGGRVVAEPVNLGGGWVGFDFEEAFGKPTQVVNDAAMQALGSYEGGKMLFLGLGTDLGSALVVEGIVEPMELGHLPFRKKTFEDYVGERGRQRLGGKKWRETVAEAIERLVAALEPDYVVLGGGNAKKLEELPPNVRLGANENAFLGAFRLWDSKPAKGHRLRGPPVRRSP